MARLPPDSLSQKIAFIAVFFGFAALVLTCVGIGTPKWSSDFGQSTNNNATITLYSINFFYACSYNSTDGSFISCVNRNASLINYYNYNSTTAWTADYYQRMQNAGALCIVGIIFLFLGTLVTSIMGLIYFQTWVTLIAPGLLFLACLFMLAGLAEGSRYLTYNDYSANLYQTGHLLTMFTLFLSALAAGRIHFSRWTEFGRNTNPT